MTHVKLRRLLAPLALALVLAPSVKAEPCPSCVFAVPAPSGPTLLSTPGTFGLYAFAQ